MKEIICSSSVYMLMGLLFLTFLVSDNKVTCSQVELSQYQNPWQSLDTIYSQFEQTHTLFEDPRCNPCDYLITIYHSYIELVIEHPQTGKFNAFEFQVDESTDQILEYFDTKKFKIANSSSGQREFEEKVTRFSRDGLEWKYQLTLPIEGIIIQGSQIEHRVVVPIFCFLFAFLGFIFYPIRDSMKEQICRETNRRTPIVSLIILSQVQHFILMYLSFYLGKYLIWETGFLMKVIWYIIFMVPIGFTILHILYIYRSISEVYMEGLKEEKNERLKNMGLIGVYFVSIYLVVFGMIWIEKGLWINYYFLVFLFWQLINALRIKRYAYLYLNLYFILCVSFLTFLNNYLPLFNFEQNTRTELVVYFSVLIGLFLIGSLVQKLVIGVQVVNEVTFEEYTSSAEIDKKQDLQMQGNNSRKRKYSRGQRKSYNTTSDIGFEEST